MEIITGVISIKKIFEINWISFLGKYGDQVREITKTEVEKVLGCREESKGFVTYMCSDCGNCKRVCFSCRSRFCNSCGTPASDKWINGILEWWPRSIKYFHLAFTIPVELRGFFLRRRGALRVLEQTAAEVVNCYFLEQLNIEVGMVSVIHTFGSQINWNPHVHILCTAGGMKGGVYVNKDFIPYKKLISQWKIRLLQNLEGWCNKHIYSEKCRGELETLHYLRNQVDDLGKRKSWYIYFSKPAWFRKVVMIYVGRYLKRPTIGQSRITGYTGEEITYNYVDKYDGDKKENTVSVDKFIQLIVQHIPRRGFHMASYHGIFANRRKKKYIQILNLLYHRDGYGANIAKGYVHRFFAATGKDPLQCECGCRMRLYSIIIPGYPPKYYDTG